jgi:hypothetical protein
MNIFMEKMPECHCGSGEKIKYICIDEKCEFL